MGEKGEGSGGKGEGTGNGVPPVHPLSFGNVLVLVWRETHHNFRQF